MKSFIKNANGAVTVFVSLLLIPAVLVTGTAVDLARIHTAESIMNNANQLASNALLSQYNALLHDIYGLFGIAEDDPVLWQLLNDYISVSVFGDDTQDRSLGTLQVFYGADLTMEDVVFSEGKNLRNIDVLRRQIEDYMKYRGPVIIINEFIDTLDGNSVKNDSVVLGDKIAIESAIAKMHEMYKRLYTAIVKTDNIKQPVGGISGGSFGAVSSTLRAIRDDFVGLRLNYEGWINAEDEREADSFYTSYNRILSNIAARITGGGSRQGLNQTIENAKIQADNFKPNFDFVVTVAGEVDEMRERLCLAVDELEHKLKANQCSEELKNAFYERHGEPAMNLIEYYRKVLEWDDLTTMAESYKDAGYEYIDTIVKPMLDGVIYRNKNNMAAGSLTRDELSAITSNSGFSIDGSRAAENTAKFAGFPADSVTYSMPPGFLPFAEISSRHSAFYKLLSDMLNQPFPGTVKLFEGQANEKGRNAEEQQRNLINSLLNMVDKTYDGIKNKPLGAMYIGNEKSSTKEKLNTVNIDDFMSQALSIDMLDIIQEPVKSLSSVWEYALLLTYNASVFSNYATARPESTGKTKEDIGSIEFPKTITNIPMSPQVNYFFQSEWEYLYNGNSNADNNLNAVTRLLFLLRMVCNYIVVFSEPAVNSVITAIKTTFAWAPILAVSLGELARAAFVAAESLTDVSLLRSGYRVPLIKSTKSNQWICTPSGITSVFAKITNENTDEIYEKGLTYGNYMLTFFITKAVLSSEAGAALAQRTADLIEWNIINYSGFMFSDEEKMAQALESAGRFKLENMKTDFYITTMVDMRMLFLSMLFAQNFANGRGLSIPKTIPVSVTDHRGY